MPYTLVSIPVSHYVEKARWALDLSGVSYKEVTWPPMLHWIGTKMAAGTKTVPILVTPSGATYADSTDILQFLSQHFAGTYGLYPADAQQLKEVQDYESYFGKKLGVYCRIAVYCHLFNHDKLCLSLLTQSLAPWKATIFRLLWAPIRFLMIKGMRISPQAEQSCISKTESIFKEVEEKLADGRQYLVGDHFTAADLTFATMAAPLLVPEGYGAKLPKIDELPEDFPGRRLRETPAGKYALRMYELHRYPAAEGGAASSGRT